MKRFFKNIKLLALAAAMGVGITSCDNEDYLVITATEPGEALVFTNTLENEYLISSQTSSNVAERFVWSPADFDAPTPVNYVLEGSVSSDFSTVDYSSGTIDATNQAVMVRDLLAMAETMGLDSDPSTNGEDGEPNNMGEVFFRVRAFVGDVDASNSVYQFSDLSSMAISMIEETGAGSGITVSSWGVVGDGANGWGGNGPDLPFYDDGSGTIFAYVNLTDGFIKFRENNTWDGDLGDANLDGVLDSDADNNIPVTAGRYKITINLGSMEYTIEEFTWGLVGEFVNGWGGSPDLPMYYDYMTNTFKIGTQMSAGPFKFRFNNDWDAANYGDTGADMSLDAGGDNIVAADGYYLITLDIANNTYMVEEQEIWGAVGDGYNAWGASPDAYLTEVQPGIWYADGVTFIDGFIKFRKNDTWDGDLGDANGDNILDTDADNNIPVTAGTYRVMVDFTDSSAPVYSLYPF